MNARYSPKEEDFDEDFTLPETHRHLRERFQTPARVHVGRDVARASTYRTLAGVFVGLTIVVVVFVLSVTFTRASVIVVPRAEAVSTDATLSVAAQPKGELAIEGAVLEKVVEGKKTITVEATKDATPVLGKSCGTVTIINDQAKAQSLVATTRLLTKDNILFRITKTISVPAHGSTAVSACADKEGTTGDIGPSTFTIPGLPESLQKKTYAKSDTAMSGGSSIQATVTEAQLTSATDALVKELADQTVSAWRGTLVKKDQWTAQGITTTVVQRDADAKVGDVVASVTVHVTAKVQAVAYDPHALATIATAQLKTAIGGSKELLSVAQEKTTVQVTALDATAGQATVAVHITGQSMTKAYRDVIDPARLAGLQPKDAERLLMSLPSVEEAKVTLSPAWARTIPSLTDHIDISLRPSL